MRLRVRSLALRRSATVQKARFFARINSRVSSECGWRCVTPGAFHKGGVSRETNANNPAARSLESSGCPMLRRQAHAAPAKVDKHAVANAIACQISAEGGMIAVQKHLKGRGAYHPPAFAKPADMMTLAPLVYGGNRNIGPKCRILRP